MLNQLQRGIALFYAMVVHAGSVPLHLGLRDRKNTTESNIISESILLCQSPALIGSKIAVTTLQGGCVITHHVVSGVVSMDAFERVTLRSSDLFLPTVQPPRCGSRQTTRFVKK